MNPTVFSLFQNCLTLLTIPVLRTGKINETQERHVGKAVSREDNEPNCFQFVSKLRQVRQLRHV
jgi:hypothetical protein